MMGLLWFYLPFLCKSQGIWGGGFGHVHKDFHKCWSGSLAKRRLCHGSAGVINYTPLSELSFWVSLFPGKHGYNKRIEDCIVGFMNQTSKGCLSLPVACHQLTLSHKSSPVDKSSCEALFFCVLIGKWPDSFCQKVFFYCYAVHTHMHTNTHTYAQI